jgi:hypothetical protein
LSEHEETVISGRAVNYAGENPSGTPNVKPQDIKNPASCERCKAHFPRL